MNLCIRGLFLLLLAALPGRSSGNAKVDRIFAGMNRTDSPGCAIGVSVAGSPVLSAAYGMADLEHGIALTPDSIFEPGSVTKQFTAAAVLLLAQQEKLSIDDPVRKYIPELPDYGSPITIRHLLNHTSGLRDWGSVAAIGGWPRTTRVYSNALALDIAAKQRALNYAPGAEYSYTNTGYNLLAILVGRVAGASLPEFSRKQIFEPLAMASTAWRDDFRRVVRNRAIAYRKAGGGFEQDMPFENAYGNGGLLTTVGDLLRWNRNFTEQTVGGRAMGEAQIQQGRLTDGRTIGYGAGLMIGRWMGMREVSHSGSTAGYSAWLGRYPERELSVAVLCNLGTNATELGHGVAGAYAGGMFQPGGLEAAEESRALGEKAGLYRSLRDSETVEIVVRDGRLQVARGAAGPVSMTFTADGRMRWPLVNEGTTFEKVEPVNPSSADLQALTGTYLSDEAETSFQVVLEQGTLVMLRRTEGRYALTPTYRDAFRCPLGSVRFVRDAQGRVEALSIGESRVWDLRFRRVG